MPARICLELGPRSLLVLVAGAERRLRQEGQAHPVVEHAVEHDIGGVGGVGEVGGLDALLLRVVKRGPRHPIGETLGVRVTALRPWVGADQCDQASTRGVLAEDDGVRAPTSPARLPGACCTLVRVSVVGDEAEAELVAGADDVEADRLGLELDLVDRHLLGVRTLHRGLGAGVV